MITTLAVSGYRSLRDLVVPLGRLTVVTGPNGSGKTSLYRALRLLAEVAQGRLVATLAAEGGMSSTMWAGPGTIGRQVRAGVYPVQGTVRREPVGLKLGFGGDPFGFAIELGMSDPYHPFPLDPSIKVESMWTGERYSRTAVFAERRGPTVQLRTAETGAWRAAMTGLSDYDSMVTHAADSADGAELLAMRERMRDWRFYDALRTDPAAPARRPQVMTYTPVLAGDGADFAAAIVTIRAIGDRDGLDASVEEAFPGSRLTVEAGEQGGLRLHQHGLLRSLGPAEWSDGTLRYLLLVAALLSPRPPELMVLNEPEASLNATLMPSLARLLAFAARRCQIILVSHNTMLIDSLREAFAIAEIRLEKAFGQTSAPEVDAPGWAWPKR